MTISRHVRPARALIERLLSARGMISVLHAPAGFGKTVLLEQAAAALVSRGEDVSTNGADLDSAELTSWIALDHEPRAELQPSALRNGLEKARHSNVGIIIATRSIADLPIARLRAEGSVLLLSARQIGMSREDAILSLRPAMNIQTAKSLAAFADGWSVAVGLLRDYAHDASANLVDPGHFIPASGLAAYIDQEVLADLSPALIRALQFTSVAESCSAEMLDFMRPDEDLGRHLRALAERLPGLVELRGGHVALNPLLRSHLAEQFRQLTYAERAATLERASRYCALTGRFAEAARLVTRVGDSAVVLDFVRRSEGLRLWVTAGYEVIQEIVKQTRSIDLEREPQLKLLKCLVHMKAGEIETAERLLSEAVPQLGKDRQAQKDAVIVRTALLLYGCRTVSDDDVAEFRKHLMRGGDHPAWNSLVLQIQALVETQRGNLDAAAGVILGAMRHARDAQGDGEIFLGIHSASIALARGDLAAARGHLGRARKLWRDNFAGDKGIEVMLDVLMASLEFEAGRLSSARAFVRSSSHRMPHVEAWLDVYAAAYETQSRLLIDDAGLPAALAALKTQRDELLASGLPRVARMLEAIEACLIGERAMRHETAEPMIVFLPPQAEGPGLSWQERELFSLASAYRHMVEEEAERAVQPLRDLIDFARPRGLYRSVLRAELLLVAAYDKMGDHDSADAAFEEALKLGSRGGMFRAFAEFGGFAVKERSYARAAKINAKRESDPNMVRMLRALSRWHAGPAASGPAKFTPREFDVLGALARGGADKMIGRKLGVTDHAVRYHLKNIYRKLGVGDRAGAIAQAREIGLVR